MLCNPPREKEWLSWCIAAAWTVTLYLTVPFARRIQSELTGLLGGDPETFKIFIHGVIVLAVSGTTLFVGIRCRSLGWRNLMLVCAVAAVFIVFAFQLSSSPIEALHILEYAVLGYLLFRALAYRIKNPLVYVAAILLGCAIGTVDEIIQWFVPNRWWDMRDIGINALSVALLQLAIIAGIRPSYISWRIDWQSVRLTCRFLSVLMVIWLLCLANTPARVSWYTERMPFLAFLQSKPGIMADYGYRHNDPEIGGFYSRLTMAELKNENARRGAEVAESLKLWRPHDKYPRFLSNFKPDADPFAYELRIHLFRRDHYLGLLRQGSHEKPPDPKSEEKEACRNATIAWRENQILEKYFSNTMQFPLYKISDQDKMLLAGKKISSVPYRSTVCRELITMLTEFQLRAIMIIILLLAIGLDIILVTGFRTNRQSRHG